MGIAGHKGITVFSQRTDHPDAHLLDAPGETSVRNRINALSPGRVRLFMSTVARPSGRDNGWLLMNRQDRGYGESARPFKTLAEIRETYAVSLGRCKKDAHGFYWEILVLE